MLVPWRLPSLRTSCVQKTGAKFVFRDQLTQRFPNSVCNRVLSGLLIVHILILAGSVGLVDK